MDDISEFLPLLIGLLYYLYVRKSDRRKGKRPSATSGSEPLTGEEADSSPDASVSQNASQEARGNTRSNKATSSAQTGPARDAPSQGKPEQDRSWLEGDFWGIFNRKDEEDFSSQPEQVPDSSSEDAFRRGAERSKSDFSTSGSDDELVRAALKKGRDQRSVEEEAAVRRRQSHRIQAEPENTSASMDGVAYLAAAPYPRRHSYRSAGRRPRPVHPLLRGLYRDPRQAFLYSEIFERKT